MPEPNAGDFGRHSDQEPPRHARRGDRLGPAPGFRRLRNRRRRRRRRRGRVHRRVVRRRAFASVAPTTPRPARSGRAISACRWRGARSSPFSTTTTAGARRSYLSAVRAAIDGRQAATFASGDIVVVDDDIERRRNHPVRGLDQPRGDPLRQQDPRFRLRLFARAERPPRPLRRDAADLLGLGLVSAPARRRRRLPRSRAAGGRDRAHRRATSGDGHSRLRADNLAALSAKHGLGPLTLRNHESIARDEAAGR